MKNSTAKTQKAEKAPRKVPAKAAPAELETGKPRREVQGVVVSDKMQKTIVVRVERLVRHPLYSKYVRKSRKFKAHDEKNSAKQGDLVVLIESRPLSRDKNWALKAILRKAGSAATVETTA